MLLSDVIRSFICVNQFEPSFVLLAANISGYPWQRALCILDLVVCSGRSLLFKIAIHLHDWNGIDWLRTRPIHTEIRTSSLYLNCSDWRIWSVFDDSVLWVQSHSDIHIPPQNTQMFAMCGATLHFQFEWTKMGSYHSVTHLSLYRDLLILSVESALTQIQQLNTNCVHFLGCHLLDFSNFPAFWISQNSQQTQPQGRI